MQKLIILDSETGICHIHNVDIEMEQYDEMEEYIEEKYGIRDASYMIALEVNDTTK